MVKKQKYILLYFLHELILHFILYLFYFLFYGFFISITCITIYIKKELYIKYDYMFQEQ